MLQAKGMQTATILGLLGLIGIFTVWPFFQQKPLVLLSELPLIFSSYTSVLISIVLLALAIISGNQFAASVKLHAPLVNHLLSFNSRSTLLKTSLAFAVLVGLLIGTAVAIAKMMLSGLFDENQVSELMQIKMPVLARTLYLGVTEEILFHWGLMAAITWLLWRLTSNEKWSAKKHFPLVYIAIAISSVIYAISRITFLSLHIPDASMIEKIILVTPAFLTVTATGYLFWRRGIEAAMLAHVVAGITQQQFAVLLIY